MVILDDKPAEESCWIGSRTLELASDVVNYSDSVKP